MKPCYWSTSSRSWACLQNRRTTAYLRLWSMASFLSASVTKEPLRNILKTSKVVPQLRSHRLETTTNSLPDSATDWDVWCQTVYKARSCILKTTRETHSKTNGRGECPSSFHHFKSRSDFHLPTLRKDKSVFPVSHRGAYCRHGQELFGASITNQVIIDLLNSTHILSSFKVTLHHSCSGFKLKLAGAKLINRIAGAWFTTTKVAVRFIQWHELWEKCSFFMHFPKEM